MIIISTIQQSALALATLISIRVEENLFVVSGTGNKYAFALLDYDLFCMLLGPKKIDDCSFLEHEIYIIR